MITQRQNNEIKGIGIILIFCLHFWYAGNGSWINASSLHQFLIPVSIYRSIGRSASMCTSIFAFLTGYSFFAARKKWISKTYRISKIFNTFLYYWIYEFIFLLIGFIMNEQMPNPVNLFFNIFALHTSVGNPYVNVVFAWYVFFYIVMILLYPLINKIDHLKSTTQIFIYISAFFLLEIMHYVVSKYFPSTILPVILSRSSLMISVVVGFLSSRYKVFERICNIPMLKKALIFLMFIILIITSRITFGELLSDIYGTLYTIILIYIFCVTKHAHVDSILYSVR